MGIEYTNGKMYRVASMPTVTGESTTPAKVHNMLATTGSKIRLRCDLMMDRRQKSGMSTAYVLKAMMRPATGTSTRDR